MLSGAASLANLSFVNQLFGNEEVGRPFFSKKDFNCKSLALSCLSS